MISDYDYPTNGTLKTVISYVSQSWLKDNKDNIELAGFSILRQNREESTSGKTRGGGVCLLVKTAGERCLILKKSQGINRLRLSTL